MSVSGGSRNSLIATMSAALWSSNTASDVASRLIASAEDTERVASSWTVVTPPFSEQWTNVCWAPELGMFVAVAMSSYNLMTSRDGVAWTLHTAPSGTWCSVCWAPQLRLFVAVSTGLSAGSLMTSSDGVTWTLSTASMTNSQSICWSPERALFIVVASYAPNINNVERIMTSPDGITWTKRVTPNSSWSAVTWAPQLGLFVIVGGSARTTTSPDGVTWSPIVTAANIGNASLRSVCWSPQRRLFVAVGTGVVVTSPDAVVWTVQTAPSSNWRSVCWAPELGLFVAVTTNSIMTSSNGITWTLRTAAVEAEWVSVAWAPQLSRFIAVANGHVMASAIGLPTSKSTLLVSPAHLCVHAATGDVGIGLGTGTPSCKLDVAGQLTLNNDSGWSNGGVRFRSVSGAGDAAIAQDAAGSLLFKAPANDGATGFGFCDGASNRIATLTNGGYLGVGKWPEVQLDLSSDDARKLTSSTWQTGCDARVKSGIQDADLEACYSNVRALKLKRFAWDSNYFPAVVDRRVLGWIAQDVETIFPASVRETTDHGFSNFKNLDSDQLIKCMYGALQRAMALLEAQEARIRAVEQARELEPTFPAFISDAPELHSLQDADRDQLIRGMYDALQKNMALHEARIAALEHECIATV